MTDRVRSLVVQALLSRPGGPPFRGSVDITNVAIERALRRLGHDVRRFGPLPDAEMIPLDFAALTLGFAAGTPVDVALYDDEGLEFRAVDPRWARRSVVLYHGILKHLGTWMGNPRIDLHCANSPWLAEVLRSLFALPDWGERRLLDARALGRVTDVRLPLPCLTHVDGAADVVGAAIPDEVQALADRGVILGHCLQPRKPDMTAIVSIAFELAERARAEGGPPFRILVADVDLGPDARRELDATLGELGLCTDDLLMAVPHLAQPALFALMRLCRFGLSYNLYPEPFGFYVLESVHNGCPVYTNGVGNNRHLLPPDHGITVLETPDMVTEEGSSEPYRVVVDAIHAGLRDPEGTAARCARGRALVHATWTEAALEATLGAALARLDDAPVLHDLDDLVVGLGPLVRRLDLDAGVVLSDRGSRLVTPDELARVHELVGRRGADVRPASGAERAALDALFREGILALRAPDGAGPQPS